MRILLLSLLLLISFNSYTQTYGEKKLYKSLGEFVKTINYNDNIKIESQVIEQEIIKHNLSKQKKINDLPTHRYEIYLVNKSTLNEKFANVIINNLKIYIDDVEVTQSQVSNGFSVIIKNEPVLIYWFETSKKDTDVKLKWKNINYYL